MGNKYSCKYSLVILLSIFLPVYVSFGGQVLGAYFGIGLANPLHSDKQVGYYNEVNVLYVYCDIRGTMPFSLEEYNELLLDLEEEKIYVSALKSKKLMLYN